MGLTPREVVIAAYFTAFGVAMGAICAWAGFFAGGLGL